MGTIKTFNHPQFGEIRTFVREESAEPWFVGRDVAKILGYSNATKAVAVHVDDEDKAFPILGTLRGGQRVLVINESGLYSLILSSKLPQSREFKRWVTCEVLPQIRKTGGYIPVEEEDDEKMILAKALGIMKRTIEQKDMLLEEQRPMVNFAKAISAHNGSIYIADMAKILTQNGYEIGATRLFRYLRENGYFYRNGRRPMQEWVEKGIFELTESLYKCDGTERLEITTLVTPKGQQYFLEKFGTLSPLSL